MLVAADPAEPMTRVAVGDHEVFVARIWPGLGGAVSSVSKRGGFLRPVAWGSWLVGRIVASGSRVCWSYSGNAWPSCAPGDPVCGGEPGEGKLACALGAGAHERTIAADAPTALALSGDLLVWADGDGVFYASLSDPDPARQRILLSGEVPGAVATDGVRVYWFGDESVWCLAPPSATPLRLARFHPTSGSTPMLAALSGDVFWTASEAIMRWSAATGRVTDFADSHEPRDLVRAGNGLAWLDSAGTLRFAKVGGKSRVIAAGDVDSVAGDGHALYWVEKGALRFEEL